MAFTFQNVADRARLALNDAAKTRWPDSELFGYGVDAYLLVRRHRPDFLITAYGSVTDFSTLTLGSNFPYVGDEYLPVIADYVVARASLKDDEAAMAERVAGFIALFKVGMLGG